MKEKTTKREISVEKNYGLAAGISTVWAIILLIAFFAYRGADAGQITSLLGRLNGAFFGFEGFCSSLLGVITAILIFLSWFGLGALIASFIKVSTEESSSGIFEFARNAAAGAAIWSLIWFFLGLAGGYKKAAALIALGLGLVLAIWKFSDFRKIKNCCSGIGKLNNFEKIFIAFSVFPVVLALLSALAPPTAKDSLLYHFALPKTFVFQGNNAIVEGNIASYLALGTEMHSVWAMLAGSIFNQRTAEAAAGATVFLFFPLLLLAIYGWSRELKIEKIWALLAVLIFATVPTAYHVAGNAYIDLALALFITLGIFALGRWWQTLESGWLIYIGIFLGAALAVKLTALFVFAAFALIVLLRARQAQASGESSGPGKIFAGGFAALVLGGLLAGPWYLRTWKETGSPIFPFYMNLWKGEAAGWDAERSALFQVVNAQYGGSSKNALDYVLTPFKISIFAQPEQTAFFDGVIGIAFLLGLPILIWALWKFEVGKEIKIAAGVCGIIFLFWLFSSQQLRYLLPVFPALAIGICAAGGMISKNKSPLRQIWQISLAASALAGILVSLAWFLEKNPLRVVFGGETKDEYLVRNVDYYPYYQLLNTRTSEDTKVWLINMRRDSYNLERPFIADYMFEDWTLRKMIRESNNVDELRARAKQLNVNYVLIRHDFLFDYAGSTIVDDKKSKEENLDKLNMVRALILDNKDVVKSDKKFSLVKLQ